jgi:hypothetical protein
MAIRKTDKVTLNGSSIGYGGLITNASYSVGFGTDITQLVLTFVSEDGNYTISEQSLDVFDTDSIKLGSRALSMIAVEYSIDNSLSGKVLKVTYNDKSILTLDKKFVALNDKNFPKTLSNPALILVGQRYYTLEKKEGDESVTVNRSTTSSDIRDLPDYLYSFQELINKISSLCENSSVALTRHSQSVLKDTTGTLRSVLSSWGSLYGFTFFFNESGKIQFVDLTSSITPIFPENVNFISEKISFSLKDTISKGHSVYYGKPGKDLDGNGTGGSGSVALTETNPSFGEFEQRSDTQIYLYRPTDNPADYWDNPGFAINLGKAAAVGESFFNYCALYLCKNEPQKYQGTFGFYDVETLGDNAKKAFDPKDDLFKDYNIIRYRLGDDEAVTVETVKQKFAQFLTYENNLAEYTYYANNWAIGADLKYDRDDTTEYVNPARESNTARNHRIYATIPFDLAFDVYESVQNLNLNKSVIPLEVSSSARYKYANYNTEDKFAAVLKDISFSNIFQRVQFKYLDNKTLRVEGMRITNRVTFTDEGGAGEGEGNYSSSIESIAFTEPNYNSNTIRTDVELDTSPGNVSSLSDIIEVPGDDIKFAGTFEVAGNLLNYPNLGYTIEQKRVQKSFTINNIDIDGYTALLEKGLQSIDISIGDDGVKTTYTIGNRNFTLPSKELVTQPRGYVNAFTKNVRVSNYSTKSSLSSYKIL